MAIDEPEDVSRRLARLESQLRFWRRGFAVVLGGGILLAVGAHAGPRPAVAQQPAQTKTADALAIYKELHEKSHRAIALIDETIKIGAPVADPSTVVAVWSNRLLGCDLYRCAVKSGGPLTIDPEVYLSTAKGPPDAERLQAFREHVARMKTWEARFRPLLERQFLSQFDFLEIQARRLQAEAWEARELSKPAS